MSEQGSQQAPPGAKTLGEIGGFELIVKVGQGGMGTVFKARQKSLDRIVALKVLPPSIAKDKNFIERFMREARASARLCHPNIVSGIDVGQDTKSGLWYFAMEFVDGLTARQLLQEKGRLPEDQALKIAKDMAGALECAHQNGMVHRDIKPDNILLNKNGIAKLADLGLARQSNDDASLTQSGVALGTPFYMAPEQVRGEVNNLDTRADLYALGATLFHLVTGQTPFQGETAAVIMAKHLSDPPPMANRVCPDVSAGCSKLIVKLMQKDRAQRLQTPNELIDQIDRLLRLPAAARSLTTGPRVPIRGAATTAPRDIIRPRLERDAEAPAPPPQKRALLYAGAGGGGVVLLGLLAFLLIPSNKPQKETKARPPEKVALRPVLNSAEEKKVSAARSPSEAKDEKPKETQLERRWREARAFAQAQPQAYEEILRRYHQLEESAGNTPLAAEIEAETNAVEEKYDTAALEAWKAAELKINDGLLANDYDGALAAMQVLPPALVKRLKEQIEARQQAVADLATKKIQPVLEQADAASVDADPDAGLKALEALAAVKYQPLAENIQQLKARLEGELANVDELKARKAQREANKKLCEMLDRFDTALLDRKDESAAARVAKEAKGATELDPVRAQADALSAILEASAAERQRKADALAALKGKPFMIGKDQGTIERVENDQLYVKISLDGGKVSATKTVKRADLTEAQRTELFPKVEATEAVRVGQALSKLSKGQEDLDGASELLDATDDFPLTKHYQDLIDRRRAIAAEAQAQKEWGEIVALAAQPMKTPAQAQPAYDKLSAFSKRYGNTVFATEQADQLAELRRKIEDVACPNMLINGDFEGGTLEGWRLRDVREITVSAEVSATAAHSGKAGLLFQTSGIATQTMNLVPGQTYRFSCWVKSNAHVRVSLDGLRDNETMRTPSISRLREWTPVTFTFTATKPDHFIFLFCSTRRPCEGCFDDIKVVKIGSVEPVAATQSDPDETVPGDPKNTKDKPEAGVPVVGLPGAAAAQFIGDDLRTQGHWKKLYGKDGYVIQGDVKKLPAYATLDCKSRLLTWDARTDDPRALLRATGNGRVAACWCERRGPIDFDLRITDGKEHSVALYLLDWKLDRIPLKVEVFDATSGAILDTQTVRNCNQGVYFTWRIKGAVKIRVRNNADGRQAFVSGVFFQ